MQCVRMLYACVGKTASEDDICKAITTKPQLTGRLPPRTPCVRVHGAR